jgi:predicted ATPase
LQAQGAFVDRERDVQRADPVALRLLSFVARRVEAARVLIVLAVRTHATSHDDTRPELERMLQELPAYPVALDGLSLDEVARYTELYRGQAPTSAMAERFHRLTGGNPLLVQQIAHTEAAGRQWDS